MLVKCSSFAVAPRGFSFIVNLKPLIKGFSHGLHEGSLLRLLTSSLVVCLSPEKISYQSVIIKRFCEEVN